MRYVAISYALVRVHFGHFEFAYFIEHLKYKEPKYKRYFVKDIVFELYSFHIFLLQTVRTTVLYCTNEIDIGRTTVSIKGSRPKHGKLLLNMTGAMLNAQRLIKSPIKPRSLFRTASKSRKRSRSNRDLNQIRNMVSSVS